MNNCPIITIGIPVYNGEKGISSTLTSIENAFKYLENISYFEVLVSDNNSTDNTKGIIDGFVADGFKIKYICNEKNIGYDANVDNIVSNALGNYVWFLGCGEIVKDDCLSRLYKKINYSDEYTNIILDFDIYSEELSLITDKAVLDFDKDILIEGKNNFNYMIYAPAVSANIINKKKWFDIVDKPLVVDGWCHVERILNMIAASPDSKTLILSGPYFTLYREIGAWWENPDSYKLLLLQIKIIKSMKTMGFNDKVVNKLKAKLSRIALINAVVQSKEYGLKVDRNTLLNIHDAVGLNIFALIFVYPLLILPRRMMVIPKGLISYLFFLKKVIADVKKNIF